MDSNTFFPGIVVMDAVSGGVARGTVLAGLCGALLASCGGEPIANPSASLALHAGSMGDIGGADGNGSAARFFGPTGITTDSAGNIFVADTGNHSLRKIVSPASVSTLAGTAGVFGIADGTGAAARFFNPTGVAVDGAGIVYVADSSNHTIRKIASGGVVTTFAGSAGSFGAVDGIGAAARFAGPQAVATDGAGNLYVTDTYNHVIRRITSAAEVSTFAGMAGAFGSADGVGTSARFTSPQGIATDAAGNVYVADTGNHTIRKIIASTGVVSTLAGMALASGSADGAGAAARFSSPQGLAVDSAGNVYVADTRNGTLRRITGAGVVSTVAGVAGQTNFVPGDLPGRTGFPVDVTVSGTSLYFTTGNGVAQVLNRP